MAEVLSNKVLFAGKGELEQIQEIYNLIGCPNEDVFPGYLEKLPLLKRVGALSASWFWRIRVSCLRFLVFV
jgi:cell division cycle 2-like